MTQRITLASFALAAAAFALPTLAAETVGQAASAAATSTGHAVGEAGRATGHAAATAGRDTGHVAATAGRETASAVSKETHKVKASTTAASTPK